MMFDMTRGRWQKGDLWGWDEASAEEIEQAEGIERYVLDHIEKYHEESYEIRENVCYDTELTIRLTKNIYRTFIFKSVLNNYWFEFAEDGDLLRYFQKNICPVEEYRDENVFDEDAYHKCLEMAGEYLLSWREVPEDDPKWTYFYGREPEETSTLPQSVMKEILERHTVKGRMHTVLCENLRYLGKKYNKDSMSLYRIELHIGKKLELLNSEGEKKDRLMKEMRSDWGKDYSSEITDFDRDFMEEISRLDRESHGTIFFPVEMTDSQIRQAIKEAYENADIMPYKIAQVKKDKALGEVRNPERGTVLYEGKSKQGLVIDFYFNIHKKWIEMAYPVLKKKQKK